MARDLKGNEGSLVFHLLRHGKTNYTQGAVPIADADDLTEEGIAQVSQSIHEIADQIQQGEKAIILSSPLGRALTGAKLNKEIFEKCSIAVEPFGKEKTGIVTVDLLSEVKNFSWELFVPLVHGGVLKYADVQFEVEKELTNPNDLTGSQYFNSDAIGKLPASVREQLPRPYVEAIDRFEKFNAVTARLVCVLRVFMMFRQVRYRIVLHSHEALAAFPAMLFTDHQQQGLENGKFVTLERCGNKLHVTRVGDKTDGNSHSDFFQSYRRYFHCGE